VLVCDMVGECMQALCTDAMTSYRLHTWHAEFISKESF
jgi:hypothetical protein